MSMIESHKPFIEHIIKNYLRKFSIYASEDFLQDAWLQLLEKEDSILQRFEKNAKDIVPFQSYLGRAVWNVCIDLGKKKYAFHFENSLQTNGLEKISNQMEVQVEEETQEDFNKEVFRRIQIALESKNFRKTRKKIELFLNIKKEAPVSYQDLSLNFPLSSPQELKQCLEKLNVAENEREKFQLLASLSGKNYESEQRWFNYQIHKIRELLKKSS